MRGELRKLDMPQYSKPRLEGSIHIKVALARQVSMASDGLKWSGEPSVVKL
jgi:hypothetical protein